MIKAAYSEDAVIKSAVFEWYERFKERLER